MHFGLYTKDAGKGREVAREAGLLLRVGCEDTEAEGDMGAWGRDPGRQ